MIPGPRFSAGYSQPRNVTPLRVLNSIASRGGGAIVCFSFKELQRTGERSSFRLKPRLQGEPGLRLSEAPQSIGSPTSGVGGPYAKFKFPTRKPGFMFLPIAFMLFSTLTINCRDDNTENPADSTLGTTDKLVNIRSRLWGKEPARRRVWEEVTGRRDREIGRNELRDRTM